MLATAAAAAGAILRRWPRRRRRRTATSGRMRGRQRSAGHGLVSSDDQRCDEAPGRRCWTLRRRPGHGAGCGSTKTVTKTVTNTVTAEATGKSGVGPPAEQVQFGYIRSLKRTGGQYRLRFDPAWFLTGVTANTAAAEDGAVSPGEPVPNDNYVVNESTDPSRTSFLRMHASPRQGPLDQRVDRRSRLSDRRAEREGQRAARCDDLAQAWSRMSGGRSSAAHAGTLVSAVRVTCSAHGSWSCGVEVVPRGGVYGSAVKFATCGATPSERAQGTSGYGRLVTRSCEWAWCLDLRDPGAKLSGSVSILLASGC
jgi:hypothetical protein